MPLAGLFRHVRLVVRLVELTGADASEDVCNDLHDAVRAIVETTTGIARERGLNSDTIMNLISETRWFDRVGD
ncbi:hypothetical protein SAMN05421684_3318 [Asanoa ishikariensis]|uniref:Uncharacterized protein n=2 Tax=Asanoa ishikariensis TaxID=137265 RepID=A0A1H3QZ54_9ACTN|nr:hypothetical protein SAMN05421684_3318 [Asanoa ishikariensis]